MKISLKIFIFTYCIMMIVTILGGFLLIHYEYSSSLEQAKATAIEDSKNLYTYVVATVETANKYSVDIALKRLIRQMEGNGENEILLGEQYELKEIVSEDIQEQLKSGQYIYTIIEEGKQTRIQVISQYKKRYIVNYYDITDIIAQRNQNYELYRSMIICTSIVIAAVLYLFSWYITRPLTNVTKMAEKISNGDYTARIDSSYKKMKSYEVEQLGNTLNHLVANTESYIEELKEAAQKKEDFMSNFTHEMKTPMTSIIGYADLLRTYDLEADKRREYSNYIYSEGKRVEKLALNLLQLIVMGKTDFPMESISMREIFQSLEAEVRFLGDKYDVNIYLDYEPATILGEKTLLISAVKNLIDNACKASVDNGEVLVFGKRFGNTYEIGVKDQGYGIPKDELSRILEPFYMVDKSRSRKQGGAGLGLSLCNEIAQIHGGEIKIISELQRGTLVTMVLKCQVAGENENEDTVSEI